MKRVICLMLVLAFCLSFSCTVFAASNDNESDFVVSPGESGTPEETTEPTTAPTTAPSTGSNPQTGDNSAIGLWIGLMVFAVVALAVVAVIYRKKFANQ